MARLIERVRRSRRTIFEALLWLAAAAVLWILSSDFHYPLPNYKFGPAHWPRVVLVLIAIAATVLLLAALLYDRIEDQNEKVVEALSSNRERVRMSLIFVLPVVYVYGMHKMGFLLVTPLFLLVYMYVFGVHRIKMLVSVTLGVYAALILVFVKLIFTPLPQGSGIFYTINGYMLGLIQ